MKVKLFNKRLWNSFIKIVSTITAGLSLVFTVFEIDQKPRIIISTIVLAALIFTFLIMWCVANKKEMRKLKINATDVIIKFGDIFEQPGVKVIAHNEYFDTQVDDKIIASNSLNGIYINKYSEGASTVDRVILEEIRLEKNVIEKNVDRPYGGKTTKYKLGSICPVGEYFLLAFTHFDDDNKAHISVADYISCLMHMWNELDRYYAERPISIALFGSGITRFNDIEIQPQELLKYIIMTYRASRVKYSKPSSLTIVLSDNVRDEINLYDI